MPPDAMRMTPKWDGEAQKPLLFNLSDDQKKDTTVWTDGHVLIFELISGD